MEDNIGTNSRYITIYSIFEIVLSSCFARSTIVTALQSNLGRGGRV